MELRNRPSNRPAPAGWLKVVLSLLLLGRSAWAVDDTFYNNGLYNNSGAQINATNVINDSGGTFSVNVALQQNWPSSLYAGWHYTQNFVNNGEMDSTFGFWFDTQNSSGHAEASSFNNSGVINCDMNDIFLNFNTVDTGVQPPYTGGIYVFSTNIVNTGTINLGADGLARFIGNNLDFTRGNLEMGSGFNITLNGSLNGNPSTLYPGFNATGETGRATNGLSFVGPWNPNNALTPAVAYSEFFNSLQAITNVNGVFAQFIYLTNATPYFDVLQTTPSNFIVRAVFIENVNTNNVTANVYFGGVEDQFTSCGFSHGYAHVEWVGSYFDPVADSEASSYLYLDDDYDQGSSTNILAFRNPGVPCNYTFTVSPTQIIEGVTNPPGMKSLFGFGQSYPSDQNVATNIYSFVDAQLIPITYPTNALLPLTSLPGRVEMTASNELNLSLTTLGGMNYLLLQCTNQFDYDGQSLISSPYSDFYLGCTNGSFALTNAILPFVPRWSGTVQAWNTRWSYTDTNTLHTNGPFPTFGNSYDFRVMLVGSQLNPTTPSQEKDVMLYGTNNITISDVLNIFGNFSINCTNLFVSTNGPGAASPDGELNLNSTALNWATSLPRLRVLTNNGAIRTSASAVQNFGGYGVGVTNYLAFVNTGVVSNSNGSLIISRDFENSGYFSAGTGSFDVQSLTTTMSNGVVLATGTFTNTGASVVIGGSLIQAGRSFTLVATNLLTDSNSTNENFWSLGSHSAGSGFQAGLVLPMKPAAGDLLDTAITNIAPSGTAVSNVWSGKDFGKSNSGFSNNAAIGWLCLDALANTPRSYFGFSGSSVSNAIYVDCLELRDFAGSQDLAGNLTNLVFNTNLVIYYAQALINGSPVAQKLDHKNNDHLRWVATYAGRFSSINLVYPDGTTNAVNAALAAATLADSDGDGTPNAGDSTPFFLSSEVQLKIGVTNVPPKKIRLTWFSIPGATNYVFYRTNLALSNWQPLTNFISATNVPPPAGWPILTNALDTIGPTAPRFYEVEVMPNNALYFPPGY